MADKVTVENTIYFNVNPSQKCRSDYMFSNVRFYQLADNKSTI